MGYVKRRDHFAVFVDFSKTVIRRADYAIGAGESAGNYQHDGSLAARREKPASVPVEVSVGTADGNQNRASSRPTDRPAEIVPQRMPRALTQFQLLTSKRGRGMPKSIASGTRNRAMIVLLANAREHLMDPASVRGSAISRALPPACSAVATRRSSLRVISEKITPVRRGCQPGRDARQFPCPFFLPRELDDALVHSSREQCLAFRTEGLRTRQDLKAREQSKFRLFRNLRERKMDVEDTRFWDDSTPPAAIARSAATSASATDRGGM